jgi:hypothetical protein
MVIWNVHERAPHRKSITIALSTANNDDEIPPTLVLFISDNGNDELGTVNISSYKFTNYFQSIASDIIKVRRNPILIEKKRSVSINLQ